MNPRKAIDELELEGSPNLGRALKYDAKQPLTKRADLAAMYDELQQRRKDLLADVKRNGIVIEVEKSNSRGAIYHATITNPAFAALRATEIQIVAIAKLLTGDPEPRQKSAAELIAETDKLMARAN